MLVIGLGQSGCAFLGGGAVEAGGAGAAYENNAYRQMQLSEEAHKAEKNFMQNTKNVSNR